MKVFLGGTCEGSNWRDILVSKLTPDIEYFNPVTDNWDFKHQQEELRQREICDICLYVITPQIKGYYALAEAVDDSNKRPEKTVLCVLEEYDGIKFNKKQMKSLKTIGEMVLRNGGIVLNDLDTLAIYLNTIFEIHTK